MSSSDTDFASLLEAAIADHAFDEIIALVRRGASPDWARNGGETLLIHAVSQGQRGLVAALIEAGANPDLADSGGDTPLIHAARHNLHSIVEDLLERQACPLKRNGRGESSLDVARLASKALALTFNDTNMSIDQIQHDFSRIERIARRLADAADEASERNAISDCHGGLSQTMTVTPPLKFRPKGP